MKLIQESLENFSARLSSETPTPGGGSTAALEALLGLSLITMTARISAAKSAGGRDSLTRSAEEAGALRQRLLDLVDEDSAAYQGIMRARSLPRKTAEAERAYQEAMQGAVEAAALCPYRILEAALEGLRLARELAKDCYPPTASDLGLGAASLKTAAQGAELTILINLPFISDENKREKYRRESQAMLEEAERAAGDLYASVRKSLLERL